MQDPNSTTPIAAASTESSDVQKTGYLEQAPKKKHTKLIVFVVGVVLVSSVTFAGMTIFIKQTVKKADTATKLPVNTPKTGTIEAVDALIISDLSDESSVSDTTSQDVTSTITGSLDQMQSLEEDYNGF